MSYSNIDGNRVRLIKRIWYKLLIALLKFPHNRVRVSALRIIYKVGSKVYIGCDFIITSILGDNRCQLILGDRVAIGPRVTVVLASDANWSKLNEYIEPIRGCVEISDDCWIGAGTIILANVKIGKCSMVGAGSVVTKDVPPYTVVAGVPAKIIRHLK